MMPRLAGHKATTHNSTMRLGCFQNRTSPNFARITVPVSTSHQASHEAYAGMTAIASHAYLRPDWAAERRIEGTDPQAVDCSVACWLVLIRTLIRAKLRYLVCRERDSSSWLITSANAPTL